MTQTQKTLALAMGVASFLFLALLAGIKVASFESGSGRSAAAPAPVDVAPVPDSLNAGPMPDNPPRLSAADASAAHLETIRKQLSSAKNDLAKATTANKGGNVEKARADLDAALFHLDELQDFITAHPETASLPAPAPLPFPLNPTSGRAGIAPNLRTALTAVRASYDELAQIPGGDLGTTREKLSADLRLAAQDLDAGIKAAATPGQRGAMGRGGRPLATPETLQGLDASHDTTMGRLAESQVYLLDIQSDLNGLSDANFAGFIEKSKADVQKSRADIDQAIAYVKAHPETNPLRSGPYQGLPVLPAPWPPPQIPDYARYATTVGGTFELAPTSDKLTNMDLVAAFAAAEHVEQAFMPDTNAPNAPQVGDIGGAKVILLGDAAQLMNDLLAGLDAAHAKEPPAAAPAPLPAEMLAPKDALSLEIAPLTPVFYEGMPLALQATFHNNSARDLRLPNNGGLYGDWMIRVESSAGKISTGGVFLNNTDGTATARASRPIPPAAGLSVKAGFATPFVYVDGDLAFPEFQKLAANMPSMAPATGRGRNVLPPTELQFPEGAYKVTLTARFPNAITHDDDPTQVWAHPALASNTISVQFAKLKPAQAGSISGTVLGVDGLPASGALVSWQRPNPFNVPPVLGSGYAKNIANNVNAPVPLPVRPNGTYTAGEYAGVTDAGGNFTIANLAPGTYIVSFSLPRDARGMGQMGSQQPIEVKSGEETKLSQPAKLNRAGGVGGG